MPSTQQLSHALAGMQVANSDSPVLSEFSRMADSAGFCGYSYAIHRVGRDGRHSYLTRTNSIGPHCVEAYDQLGLVSVNPVLPAARKEVLPFMLSELVAHTPELISDTKHPMLQFWRDFAIGDGVVFPLHGLSPEGNVFGLSILYQRHGATERVPRRVRRALHVAVLHLHERMLSSRSPVDAASVTLTARETECLAWTAAGKTSADIAAILNLSDATVNFHMKNLLKKLGAKTRAHAVARAAMLGILVL